MHAIHDAFFAHVIDTSRRWFLQLVLFLTVADNNSPRNDTAPPPGWQAFLPFFFHPALFLHHDRAFFTGALGAQLSSALINDIPTLHNLGGLFLQPVFADMNLQNC
jgi:hypothetical protein